MTAPAAARGSWGSRVVGWVWGADQAVAELSAAGQRLPAARVWVVLIRYVCPLAILFIIVMTARGMFAG